MSSGAKSEGPDFDLEVVGGHDWDPEKDNVDIEVSFKDGRRYAATFFTMENIRGLFERNESSGECMSGLYLWSSDMIIVQRITLTTIRETVVGLIEAGELDAAFSRVDSEAARSGERGGRS